MEARKKSIGLVLRKSPFWNRNKEVSKTSVRSSAPSPIPTTAGFLQPLTKLVWLLQLQNVTVTKAPEGKFCMEL